MSSSKSYFYNVKFIFSPLWMCLLFFGQVSAAEKRISQLSYDPLTSEMNMTLPSEGSGEYVDDYYDDGPNMTTTYREYYSNFVDLDDHNNISEIISGHNHGNKTEDETYSSVSVDITDTANGLQGLNGSVQLPYSTMDSTPPKGTTVPTLLISTDSDKGKEGRQNGATSGSNGLTTLSSSTGGTGYFSGRLGRNGSLVIPTIKFTSGPFKRTEESRGGAIPSAVPVTQPLTISPVINLYPMLSPFACPCSCTSSYSWANPFSSMGPYSWANPCQSPGQYPWASQYQCHFHNHMPQLPPQYPYPYSQTNVGPMPIQFQNTPGAIKQFPSVVNPGGPPVNPGSPPSNSVPIVERSSFHVMPPIPRAQNSISYQLIT